MLALASHDTANAATARLTGFTTAVSDGGGRVDRTFSLHDTASYYPGYYGTEQLLASQDPEDCIFYQNDTMAFGGLQYCERIGLRVPDDIGIAGWGDMPIAAVLPRRLTSIHVSHLKIGQKAAEAMVSRVSGEPTEPTLDEGFHMITGSTVRSF